MAVTPREGRVSRNFFGGSDGKIYQVTPREGRVSRNPIARLLFEGMPVTPREGRVSRNWNEWAKFINAASHAPRGACE